MLYLCELTSSRTRTIIEDLENCALSLALVKIVVVNLIILNNEDNKFIFKLENFEVTINGILINSKFKVIPNVNVILFFIKFPVVANLCNATYIYPVFHSNKILKL